jgi:hypothetical protein
MALEGGVGAAHWLGQGRSPTLPVPGDVGEFGVVAGQIALPVEPIGPGARTEIEVAHENIRVALSDHCLGFYSHFGFYSQLGFYRHFGFYRF